ncbi:MAG: N-acetyltransferase, partial [Coprobacillus sp.]
ICCAITEKKGETCISSKKDWLKERMKDGLCFVKLDIRGKVFIEYLPAQNAWSPIETDNYMYINCFWVSGQYKGQGYANQLLTYCINDAKEKGMNGLVVLSSEKKKPYLSDGQYLKHKGFLVADSIDDFELLYLPFHLQAKIPKFKKCVYEKEAHDGWVLYYTHQCPHTSKYVPILKKHLSEKGIELKTIHIQTIEEAQNLSVPVTTYALFYNGQFITNEILSEKSFDKLLLKLKIES